MKRIAVAVVGVLGLTACGPDSVSDRYESDRQDSWYALTDPQTGRTFRCHEIISDTSHQYDVRTEWCYEP